ncbi:MAG TPA: hypothetical protein DHV17_04400 [Chitinophagaceae bacterium]|nr:hypothetical protein [Chitinophagaceae bacterium]
MLIYAVPLSLNWLFHVDKKGFLLFSKSASLNTCSTRRYAISAPKGRASLYLYVSRRSGIPDWLPQACNIKSQNAKMTITTGFLIYAWFPFIKRLNLSDMPLYCSSLRLRCPYHVYSNIKTSEEKSCFCPGCISCT